MIDDALILAFGILVWAGFYLAYAGREERIFRVFFMSLGFLGLYGMFDIAAAFVQGYSVSTAVTPSSTTMYYTAASISGLTNLLYAFDFVVEVAVFLYLVLELVLYLKYWLDMRKIKAKQKRSEYPNYNE